MTAAIDQADLFSTPLEQARARRDKGIEDSAAHADQDLKWTELAAVVLRAFLLFRGRNDFLAEDFVAYAKETRELPDPPDGRAFGSVMKRAQSKGLIVKIGYRAAKSSNLSPKVLWRKV